MSTTTDSATLAVLQQIVISIGFPVLITGVIGGILNIIVFLSLKTFRQNSCAFFLTIMSFVNIGQLLFSLLSRIMISGYSIDWTQSSLFYCKFRNYCLQVCALLSYTCMCLATIDQFLATSLRPQWQQFFNIRRAYGISIIFFLIWLLHGIPTLLSYNLVVSSVTGKTSCVITNPNFQVYNSYGYLLILTGILPICITVLFGSLAYWQVRQIPYRTVPLVRRGLDKQLTSMVLIQVVFNIIVIIPYVVVLILLYTPGFTSTSVNINVFNITYTTLGMIYYSYFAASFYIYVIVSKRFRQQLLHVLAEIYFRFWKHQPIPANQISPESITT